MIAFTNHALDHMLCSVLDAQITKKIVRLGRRASDERIAKYSIDTLEMAQKHSRIDKSFNVRREFKKVQEDITILLGRVLKVDIENDSGEIMKYISAYHLEHYNYFCNPPKWLSKVRAFMGDGVGEDAGEWRRAGPKGTTLTQDTSNYAFWKECDDFAFVNQVTSGHYSRPKPTTNNYSLPLQNAFSMLAVENVEEDQESESDLDSDDQDDTLDVEESWKDEQYGTMPTDSDYNSQGASMHIPSENASTSPINSGSNGPLQPEDFQDLNAFFVSLGFNHPPSILSTDRQLEELLQDVGDVWSMSQSERQRIHKFWVEEARKELRESSVCEFKRLRELHAQHLRQVNETNAEVCLNYDQFDFSCSAL